MKKVFIKTATINLDQFLKWAGAVATGGEAKNLIKEGRVKVNGRAEVRRSKKLYPGNVVEIFDETFMVARGEDG
ncbi:RNA-binding S4 domain-containing protein [Thermoanaerobacterium sp. DL9XJH110]|uniref:RNA-binding S4 domain-containing protein n=1 Tax=Thermoanaerobacterium sp. DL9XJH110 TaxID=3386643 RepID=UPI003BB4B6DC